MECMHAFGLNFPTRILPLNSPDIQELGHLLLEHVVLRRIVTHRPLVFEKPSRRKVVTIGTWTTAVVILNRTFFSLGSRTTIASTILKMGSAIVINGSPTTTTRLTVSFNSIFQKWRAVSIKYAPKIMEYGNESVKIFSHVIN